MMKLKLYLYVFKKNLHVNSLKETRTELRIEVTNDLSSKTLLISESLDMLASWTDIWRAAYKQSGYTSEHVVSNRRNTLLKNYIEKGNMIVKQRKSIRCVDNVKLWHWMIQDLLKYNWARTYYRVQFFSKWIYIQYRRVWKHINKSVDGCFSSLVIMTDATLPRTKMLMFKLILKNNYPGLVIICFLLEQKT
jgi:hypothetical protein